MASVVSAFVGGAEGPWRVERLDAVTGPALPGRRACACRGGPGRRRLLRRVGVGVAGAASYEQYVRRVEHDDLAARSPELGRPEATRAALIPISKSSAWWALPQDERREIFEERSHHIATGLVYLPAIARRHHGRDLGEPFDFLTWFEYASADA
ncbi:MAG: chlorite dismutase [Geodermatophilaceae bacterium]